MVKRSCKRQWKIGTLFVGFCTQQKAIRKLLIIAQAEPIAPTVS